MGSQPHPMVFSVECCAQPRVLINGVVLCHHCDSVARVPNSDKVKKIDPKLSRWRVQ